MTTAVLRLQKTAKIKLESLDLPIVNWKIVSIIGFIVLALLMVFYAYQIIGLTKGYYLVNSYEKQMADMLKENKNLQLNFAESGYLTDILRKAEKLDFYKTISVKYIKVADGSVAVAK